MMADEFIRCSGRPIPSLWQSSLFIENPWLMAQQKDHSVLFTNKQHINLDYSIRYQVPSPDIVPYNPIPLAGQYFIRDHIKYGSYKADV